MSNAKEMKIMKKLFYGALALGILAVSCNKEIEAPVIPSENEAASSTTYTIKAVIGDETRTAYADFQKFSWLAEDKIDVFTYSEADGYTKIKTFTAQADGVTTDFVGEVEDGYVPGSLAVYPDNAGFVNGEAAVYLPTAFFMDDTSGDYYSAPSDNPLQNLALVGIQNEDGSYAFKTAMGGIKLTFSDLPAEARFLRIYDPTEKIAGYFYIDEDGLLTNESAVPGTYTYTDSQGTERTSNYSSHNLWYHFEPEADGTATLYIPLPVGKVSSGTTFFIEDEDENVLFEKQSRKDIVIERNKITELTVFGVGHDWESLGVGYFYDYPIFYYMGSSYLAPVEIFRDKNNPGVYRIENPYPVAAETGEYTILEEYLPLPEYYSLTVSPDNFVTYDDMHSGYGDGNGEGDVFAACPGSWGDVNTYNFVAKYQEDGTPANIILSSLYLYQHNGGYYYYFNSDSYKFMWTMLLFPGIEDQLDLSAEGTFVEVVDDSPAQAIGQVSVKLGDDVPSAFVVIAADEAAAEAAITAGKGVEVTEADATVAVNFPADAPSGKYIVYVKTVAGEGFTQNCALGFASDPFDYFRSDEDRGLTVEDLVGTYKASNYYNNGSGWTAKPVTMTIVVEESDDPLSGEIMFTDICPEVLSSFGTVTKVANVYPDFNTATGVITIPGKSEIYKAGRYTYTVADFYGEDATLFFTTDGTLYLEANIAFYDGNTRAAWTNQKVTFSKVSSSSAPALAPAQQLGPVSFEPSEPTASRPVPMRAPENLPYVRK